MHLFGAVLPIERARLEGGCMVFALAVLVVTHGTAYAQSADDPVTVYMGVLTPGSAIEVAAIEQSITDVNDMLVNIGAEWRLGAVYPDNNISITEFIIASQEDGVMAFVGPGDAVSLLRAKEAIAGTGYNAVYVGCCVPATHHGILGSSDNVFVLAPDVLDQAATVAAAMDAAGIEYAIPVYSGDLQSSSMRASIAAQFDGVMDSGVLVPPHTLDYSLVVSALSTKVESANGKAAVLVLEPDATGGLMAAGYALADVSWFGTSSVSGLPSLDGAVANFAESVGYTVPMFGTLHEPRLMVNLLYTQEAWSAYSAVQIAAYSLSDPTADFVTSFGRWSPMPVQAPSIPDTGVLAAALPLYAALYGGGTGSTELDVDGGLKSATYLLYGMADGTWVKEAIYNPSAATVVGRMANGEMRELLYSFEPTNRLYDVHTVGALLPLSGSLGGPAEQRLTAARVALFDLNMNSGVGNDWYVDLLIEDTQTDPGVTLEKLEQLDRLGVKMVVGPSASSSAAAVREYADENNIILLSLSTSHALSISGDSLYRVTPSNTDEATVLAKMLERDDTEHVIAIYRQDLWGDTLTEGLLSEFSGTINTENGYSPELANRGILDYEGIAADVAEDVLALVEEHGDDTVAVMMIGFEESAGILEAASHHAILGSVQWYGSAGNTNRLAIPANDAALAFAESVDFKGPILIIDDNFIATVKTIEHLTALHPEEYLDPYMFITHSAVLTAGSAVGRTAGLDASEVGPILNHSISNTVNFIPGDGLDENGDLTGVDYDIWQIKDGGWQNILVYDSGREKFLSEVIVGVPVSLSGVHASVAPQRTVVYVFAELAVNEALAFQDADWRLVLAAQDTGGDPQKALNVVKSMHKRGINLLLGPPDTASLNAVRQYVEENDMLAINCCSTGTGLALPDRIFRLVPDDTREAEALNALFEEHSTGHLVIVYRNDVFGSSLNQVVTEAFGGGTTEIPYDSGLADLNLLDYGSLAAQITGAVQAAGEQGESNVAILLVGHDESVEIMASASEHRVLGSMKWYGTSGIAKQLAITAHPVSAKFAEAVDYEAVLFAEPPPDPFVVGGLTSTRLVPDAYTYAAYDAVALLAAAVEAAGSDDAGAVAAVLPQVASQFLGTLGNLTLNANGDLDQYTYDIWHVRNGAWEVAATYHPDEGLEYRP